MKYARILIPLVLFAAWMTGCAPQPTAEPAATTPLPPAGPTPTAGQKATPAPAGSAAAVQKLAGQLNLPAAQVSVVSSEAVDWPDACLGLASPGEMCATVITPGYKVVLSAGGKEYTFRTNQKGTIVRQEPGGPTPPAVSVPAVGPQRAIDVLAEQLQIQPGQVQVVTSEAVDWPDACLGVHTPGEMCAQVITPGYRVVLEANGQRYEFHTNQPGTVVRQAPQPFEGKSDVLLEWTLQGENCLTARFSAQAVEFGACKSAKLTQAPYAGALRGSELATLMGTYQAFEADTPAGKVVFHGQGSQTASADEQRSIAEWARLVSREAESGRDSAAAGVVIGWHREGGIAGFCDDLAVYLTGFTAASSCKGGTAAPRGSYRLTADQLKQLYAWMDGLKPFEFNRSDPATADAMKIRVAFSGLGKNGATAADQDAIQTFAAGVCGEVMK